MIELRNINVERSGGLVLKNIDLTINQGEKILLQGESGSGKSTLVKTILFYTQFSGEILYRGTKVNEANIAILRQQAGYIGQTLPVMNMEVKKFLQLPYQFQANRSIRTNTATQKEQLGRVGLDETVLSKNFSELSGGEKQRLLALQILALQRPIYFFDEITSGLDKKNIKKLIALITADHKRTIVSISHNQEWDGFCNRFIHLDQGAMVKES